MKSFWNGFEKQAIMFSNYAGKGQKAYSRYRKAIKLQLENRLKNENLKVVENNPHLVTKLKSKFLNTLKNAPASFDPLLPRRLDINTKKLPKNIRNMAIHHEADEKAGMKKAIKDAFKNDFNKGKEVLKSVKDSFKSRTPKPLVDSIKNFSKSRAAENQELAKKFQYLKRFGHIDPEVVLKESNRISISNPTARDAATKMRRRTGEYDKMKRHGLRYGEEYIPEGGRRWRKLVEKLKEDISTHNIPSIKAKNIKKDLSKTIGRALKNPRKVNVVEGVLYNKKR